MRKESSNRRLMRDLLGSQPPARAGNLLRRERDMFFEAHQLPVARAVGEGETGLAGKADHDVVGAQRIAEQPFGAERCRAAFEVFEQCRTDTVALPAVVDKRRWPASLYGGDAGAHDPPKCERFGDKIHAPYKNLERDRTQNRIPLLLVALPAS